MEKVKLVCKELNITQNELAELLGIHYTTFSKWKKEVPKSSEVALDLLLENHKLKSELAKIKEALKFLRNLENF